MQLSRPPRTLAELLLRQADRSPERVVQTFTDASGVSERSLGSLARRACELAVPLAARAQPGDRVVLALAPGLDFVDALFACCVAGLVATPVPLPRRAGGRARLEAIVASCEPALIVTESAVIAAAAPTASRPGPTLGPTWVDLDTLRRDAGDIASSGLRPLHGGLARELAILQYTSGSTGSPRGVRLTHANVLANLATIAEGFALDRDSVGVSWLPHFHDMGLIGTILAPVYAGFVMHRMAPAQFMARPATWLEAISRTGASVSGGPNFAYELCVRAVDEETPARLSLSRWRVAFVGAEPVRAPTMAAFARRYAAAGFEARSLLPCYGLAEATLFVTGVEVDRAPRTLSFDADAFDRGEARPVADEESPAARVRTLVGCGSPRAEPRLSVEDRAGRELPEGTLGELVVRGASVSAGYFESAGEVNAGEAAGEAARTGDLGFIHDGELFVAGRIKDLIVVRGRNIYPEDIEAELAGWGPPLRPGRAAAFAVEGEGSEEVVLVQEVHVEAEPPAGWDGLATALYERVSRAHELELHALVLVRAGQVRLTSSGKVRRFEVRERWLGGTLEHLAVARASGLDFSHLAGLEADERRARLRTEIECWLELHAGRRPRAGEALAGLGLDSLMLARLGAAFTPSDAVDLPTLFGATVESLVERLDVSLCAGEVAVDEPELAPPGPRTYPRADGEATRAERGFWHNAKLAPEASADVLARAAWIEGELDGSALAEALRALARTWPMLRARFVFLEGVVTRSITALPTEILVCEERPGADAATALADMRDWALRPMDLERGPLLRARALRGRDGWLFGLAIHHAIADESALRCLADGLARNYGLARGGGRVPASDARERPSSAGVARAEAERLASASGRALAQRWRERLSSLPRALAVPPEASPRPALVTGRRLGHRALADLRELASRHACSPFTVLLAVVVAVSDGLEPRRVGPLCVTIPADTRTSGAFVDQVACLANLLPVVIDQPGDERFAELVERCAGRLAEAIADQQFPYAQLVAEHPGLSPELVLSYHPELDDRGLQAWAAGLAEVELNLGGLRLRTAQLDPRHAQFPLHLRVVVHGGALHLGVVADARRYGPAAIERLFERLELAITTFARRPEARSSAAADRPRSQHTRVEGPQLPAPWVLDRIRDQAWRRPDACALSSAGGQLSYAGLLTAVDALAAEIEARGSTRSEVRVGLCLPRGPGLLVGLLATLEAGAVYVALDPSLPAARLRELATRARCELLVTLPGLLEGVDVPRVDSDPRCAPSRTASSRRRGARPASALACVLYTSGSTGEPKGVALTRGGLANLMAWAVDAQGELLRGRVFAGTGVGFDLSTFELLGPLCCGGTVVLGAEPLGLPVGAGVTLLNTVPSLAAAMLATGRVPASLRGINLAGEALSWGLVEALRAQAPGAVIHNLYGPSETTTYSTVMRLGMRLGMRLDAAREGQRAPEIGVPIAGTICALAPGIESGIGAAELCIGGAGLARGYLDAPGATAARFVPDPGGAAGARLYRSGDRCELDEHGRLHYLGRLDRQIKLAGVRIEPGEIEAALLALPSVRQAVVRVDEGRRVLVAHVVADAETIEPEVLRRELAVRLPAAMVPGEIDVCERMPRTARGKIDLAALAARPPAARPFIAPQTELETELAALWAEQLGVTRVGRDDDFFALGGHSLAATILVAELEARYGIELPIRTLFERPSLAVLAEAIEAARWLAQGGLAEDVDDSERDRGSL